MTSVAHTETTRVSHLRAHLGTYVAGAGATAGLVAGGVVVFLSMAAFVAFNGLPFAGSNTDSGTAYLGSEGDSAASAAGASLGAARAAVAKDPVRGARSGPAAATGPRGNGAGEGGGRGGGAGGGSDKGDATTTAPGGGDPVSGGSGGGGPVAGVPAAPSVPSIPSVQVPPPSAGPVTGAVGVVDRAAGTDVGGTTGGATGAIDGAVTGVDRVGGAVGQPNLGQRVGSAVSGVTDHVLGGGGSGSGLVGG